MFIAKINIVHILEWTESKKHSDILTILNPLLRNEKKQNLCIIKNMLTNHRLEDLERNEKQVSKAD